MFHAKLSSVSAVTANCRSISSGAHAGAAASLLRDNGHSSIEPPGLFLKRRLLWAVNRVNNIKQRSMDTHLIEMILGLLCRNHQLHVEINSLKA